VRRGHWLGKNVNRVTDGFIGAWSSSVTFQTGQSLFLVLVSPRTADVD